MSTAPKKLAVAIGVLFLLAGIGGILAHYFLYPLQTNIQHNLYVPLWFAAILSFVALNLIFITLRPHEIITRRCVYYTECLFLYLFCIGNATLMVVNAMLGDFLSFTWNLLSTLVTLVTIAVLLNHKKFQMINFEVGNTHNNDDDEFEEKPTILSSSDGSSPNDKNDKGFQISCVNRMLGILMHFLKFIMLFVLVLLVMGTFSANYANSYPAPGERISIEFDGTEQPDALLHYYCIGDAASPGQPTVFITSSSAHGVVDFYGLQHYLNFYSNNNESTINRRVCTLDPLGFGWSDPPMVGQYENYEYLFRLMNQIAPPANTTTNNTAAEPVWDLIGWGGGGSDISYIAKNYPSYVRSLTYVEVYPPDIEFSYYAYENNLTPEETDSYRHQQLTARLGMTNSILSIAIPLGMMSIFIPAGIKPEDAAYYPANRWAEFRVQSWKSNLWMNQELALQHMRDVNETNSNPLSGDTEPLPSGIPVLSIGCVTPNPCNKGNGRVLEGEQCESAIRQNEYYTHQKFSNMLMLNPNTTFVNNTDLSCGLGLPVADPEYVASNIHQFYQSLNNTTMP